MSARRRTLAIPLLVAGAVLLAAATVGAATTTGTAGHDTLRRTAKADKLNGRAGNGASRTHRRPHQTGLSVS